jgi:hypothetical protein
MPARVARHRGGSLANGRCLTRALEGDRSRGPRWRRDGRSRPGSVHSPLARHGDLRFGQRRRSPCGAPGVGPARQRTGGTARHAALAAKGPSEPIAAKLTAAAAQIRSRGAPDAAADLLELAASLTPENRRAARVERAVGAAENHFHSGDRARASVLASEVIASAPARPLLGRAYRLLGMIRYHEDSYRDANRLLEQAADHLHEDPLVGTS